MFLQTILQLHILLAATPALAGWTLLMPSAQSLPAHVYYFVSQNAAGEKSSASAAPCRVVVIRRTPANSALWHPSEAAAPVLMAQAVSFASALDPSPVSSYHPYPYAARAP